MINFVEERITYILYKVMTIIGVLVIAFGIGMYIAHITAGTPTPTDTTPTAHELLDRIPDSE